MDAYLTLPYLAQEFPAATPNANANANAGGLGPTTDRIASHRHRSSRRH